MFVPHFTKVRASFVAGSTGVDTNAMAQQLLVLTNAERRAAGLNMLAENSELTKAAYAKANAMLAEGYFSHTSPKGKIFYSWVDATGYEYSAVAENLAVNLNMISAKEMVSSWLNSPGHRANLLSSAYTEAGMGVSYGVYEGQEAVFAVHIFAHPKNQVANKIAAKAPALSAVTVKNIEKSIPVKSAPVNPIVKNVAVLGEAVSIITSPLLASAENLSAIATTSRAVETVSHSKTGEPQPRISWFKKLIKLLFT